MPRTTQLEGLTVAVFESRLAATMKDLLAMHGALVLSAPAMKEVPLAENPAAFRFAEELFAGRVDALVLLTGVGARALLETLETRYPRERVLEAWRKIPVVPRGPKPVRVLNELGVPFALTVPEPNTWREILAALDAAAERVPLRGKTVAVQEYGEENPELASGLEERGSSVMRVPVYRWALPDDTGPLREAARAIAGGRADAAVFTTAAQARHLFRVAEEEGFSEKLRQAFARVVTASVGPDCSRALREMGLRVDIEPESPKMGPLVAATAAEAKTILEKLRKK
ncbi:MAG TPA: uroporphyrinogen-III synthase [Candidatus Eisenbacteria bacterium]|jgi:uroporphyrinogen-III synthase|nr:uroporphyrinogen-III synthase [Candidatus Eisenbacteria bacterium]